MYLFFQMHNLQLLIFCMESQEFLANFDYVLLCLFLQPNQIKHFYTVLLYSFLHPRSLLVLCAYVSIETIDGILLSWLEFKGILLIFLVKALCFYILNPCCILNTSLINYMNSFWSFWRLFSSILFCFEWFILFSIWAASKQLL